MNKKGFTLIELLIVVVIIGILAAIAIPKFGESRERTYQAAMQSDLNQLRTAMEACLSDNTANPFTYTGCNTVEAIGLNPSPGVSIAITIVDPGSYTAAATHTSTARTCSYSSTTGQTTCEVGGADGGDDS